ncbi:MAG TPA: hypothetical protein VHH09_07510 [Acidimicrobiales bacterium]|nr:hypothetical protein [Acidimicrobiales bacterium]
MATGPGPLEDVIRTGASVLTGHLAAQEAVTILATMAPQAVRAAARCRQEDAEQAGRLAAVLRSLAAEVAPAGTDAQRRAVAADLSGVAAALEAER